MADRFPFKPISNLPCSPIGLVPKKTGGLRLITHLSYPAGLSVNDRIDDALATVKYSNFDNAVGIIKMLGKGALLGKFDVKSVFRLLPLEIRVFPLLGIKVGHNYYIDKMAPMGLKFSCAAWEAFAKFLNWTIEYLAASLADCENADCDHYLDDFILLALVTQVPV